MGTRVWPLIISHAIFPACFDLVRYLAVWDAWTPSRRAIPRNNKLLHSSRASTSRAVATRQKSSPVWAPSHAAVPTTTCSCSTAGIA
jgi:hypothetical protein